MTRAMVVVTVLSACAILAVVAAPRRGSVAPSTAPDRLAPGADRLPDTGATTPLPGVAGGSTHDTRAFLDEAATGQIAFDEGRLEDALAAFVATFEKNPRNAHAANSAGQTLTKLGRPAEAVTHLERAVSLAPDRSDFHFNLARALGQAGRWSDAVEAYQRAAGLDPDSYATAFNLAQALEQVGNTDAALDEYRRGTHLAPLEPSFRLAIGNLSERRGQWDDATQAYEAYLELAPDGTESARVRQHLDHVNAQRSAVEAGGESRQ